MNYNLYLLSKSKELFLKKEDANIADSEVVASIITAAKEMSNYAPIPYTEEDTVTQELLEVYQRSDDEEVKELIGTSPQYVKNAIGFSIDFKDANQASLAYEAEKEKYDDFYRTIEKRKMNYAKEKSL